MSSKEKQIIFKIILCTVFICLLSLIIGPIINPSLQTTEKTEGDFPKVYWSLHRGVGGPRILAGTFAHHDHTWEVFYISSGSYALHSPSCTCVKK